jgi:hypothetical protein
MSTYSRRDAFLNIPPPPRSLSQKDDKGVSLWERLFDFCEEKWVTTTPLAKRFAVATNMRFDEPTEAAINNFPNAFLNELFLQAPMPQMFNHNQWQKVYEIITKAVLPSCLEVYIQIELQLSLDTDTKRFVARLPWDLMKHEIMSYNTNGICDLLLDKYGIKLS